tara:strand:- start:3400 stop:4623 length:1224 start_codon:yes stop_codon:yes gene_type:complete
MEFFNKKEEVIDVKLTQYGKNLLSRGAFKPVYYMFFDDDILYDASKGGFTEEQNETEKRILENTPKLKTQYLTLGVEEAYENKAKENHALELLDDGYMQSTITSIQRDMRDPDLLPQAAYENEGTLAFLDYFLRAQIRMAGDNRFTPLRRNCDHDVQEKILLYPLYDQEIQNPNAPRYDILSLDAKFKDSVSYQHFTASGIIKNVPQLKMSPGYKIILDNTLNTQQSEQSREDILAQSQASLAETPNGAEQQILSLLGDSNEPAQSGPVYDGQTGTRINSDATSLIDQARSSRSSPQGFRSGISSEESFVDLTSDEIIFNNNTKLKLEKNSIILDIEELNSYFGSDNFTLQIFEIKTRENKTDHLREIDDIFEIRDLFNIKSDNSIKLEGIEYKTRRQKNNKKRSDL